MVLHPKSRAFAVQPSGDRALGCRSGGSARPCVVPLHALLNRCCASWSALARPLQDVLEEMEAEYAKERDTIKAAVKERGIEVSFPPHPSPPTPAPPPGLRGALAATLAVGAPSGPSASPLVQAPEQQRRGCCKPVHASACIQAQALHLARRFGRLASLLASQPFQYRLICASSSSSWQMQVGVDSSLESFKAALAEGEGLSGVGDTSM